MRGKSFIAVVGHGPDLDREDGAQAVLRNLGAEVRSIDLWDDPHGLFGEGDEGDARAIVVEALERPDLGTAALRALRKEPRLEGVGALMAVTVGQVARIEPAGGFDDFVLSPYVPAELYARIRQLEWQKSEFSTEERFKVGAIVVDRAAHEVSVAGTPVGLTAKEFSVLAYLCDRRGRVVSRDELLKRVWGNRYEGGARTVDIHVRRLRAKLGAVLPLSTLRGAGYKLEAPDGAPHSDRDAARSARQAAAKLQDRSARQENLPKQEERSAPSNRLEPEPRVPSRAPDVRSARGERERSRETANPRHPPSFGRKATR